MEQKLFPLGNRGMNRDTSVSKASNEFAFENHNIRILARDHDTLMSVTNERGNRMIEGIEILGTVIGWNVLNEYLILFTTKHEQSGGLAYDVDRIYRIKYSRGADNEFRSILIYEGIGDNSLNFDTEHPIESIVDFETDDIMKIYWLDGKNVLRMLNFSDTYLKSHLESGHTMDDPVFDFNGDSTFFDSTKGSDNIPAVTITKNESGSSRQNGVIQYFVTYYDKNGIQTGIVWSSPLVYLAPESGSSSPEGFNYSQVTLELSSLDTSFDYVRVYAIVRTSENITNSAFVVGDAVISKDTQTAKLIDNGNSLEPIDITSLLFIGSRSAVAGTLAQKDGTLFLGDLKSVGNRNIQSLEDAIKNHAFDGGQYRPGESWKSALISFEYSSGDSDIPYASPSGLYPYRNQLNYTNAEISTFKGGEKYRFALRFFKNNGEATKAFWIGDKVNDLYPQITDSETIHRALAVCSIPSEIVSAAMGLGYTSVQLLIAEALYSDRSVKAQGIVNPTLFNLYDRFKNTPYSHNSWMYRFFGGKYAHNHFDVLHRSDSTTAELQNSWWDDKSTSEGSKLSSPYPLFMTDNEWNIIGSDRIQKYKYIVIEGDVNAQAVFEKYWGYLVFKYYVNDGDTDPAVEHGYSIGNRNLGQNSRRAIVADWLEAYKSEKIPTEHMIDEATINQYCDAAKRDADSHIAYPGTYHFRHPGEEKASIDYAAYDLGRVYSGSNREYFFVDNSVVTLNSPEIEYGAVHVDKSNLKFRIVGVARVTGNISDYTMLTEDFNYVGNKIRDVNLNVSNISDDVKSVTARPLYLENSVNSQQQLSSSPYAFMTYMWHKTGSIPESTYQEKKLSVLKTKRFANLYFSYYSIYNNYGENPWFVSPSEIRQFDSITEQLYEFDVAGDRKIYAANVNELVITDADVKYPILYTNRYDTLRDDILSLKETDDRSDAPVPLTYNSRPHAVISLPKVNGSDTILPWIFDSDKFENAFPPEGAKGPFVPWSSYLDGTKNIIYRECDSEEPTVVEDIIEGAYDYFIQVGDIDWINQKISLYVNAHGIEEQQPKINRLRSIIDVYGDLARVYAMIRFYDEEEYEKDDSPLIVDVSKLSVSELKISFKWSYDILHVFHELSADVTSSGVKMSSITYYFTSVDAQGLIIDTIEYTHSVSVDTQYDSIFATDVIDVSAVGLSLGVQIHFYDDTEYFSKTVIRIPKSEMGTKKTYSSYWKMHVNNASFLNPRITMYTLPFLNLYDMRLLSVSNGKYIRGEIDSDFIYQNPNQEPYTLQSDFLAEGSKYAFIGELYDDFDALPPHQDTRYGGITPTMVQKNTFIPASGKVRLESPDDGVEVVGNEGDTFFQRWDSIKAYPMDDNDQNQVLNGLSVMLETHINIEGRNDIDRGTTKLTSIDYTQFGKLNPVYSQRNNFQPGYVTDESLNLDTYRTSVAWTLEKKPNAAIDEWTHVTLANTLMLDGDKGPVSALRRFQNSIIAFQEKGIAEILYNSRTQVSTTEGIPVEIANSGKVDGKRYLTNRYGTLNKWSIVEGKTGIYFIDNINRIIGVINGDGIKSLSTEQKFDAWVRDNHSVSPWNPDTFDNFVTFYDKVHSDVYFIKNGRNGQPCLVYSEILGSFVSFYDYSDVPMMTNIEDRFVSCRRKSDGNSSLWLQNEGRYCNFFGEDRDFWMTWRVAPDSTDKIWTNLEYHADFLEVLASDEDRHRDSTLVYDRYAFKELEKVDGYLYDARYGELDYFYAYEYFSTRRAEYTPGACTAFNNGKVYARNLDWLYSNQVDFIVRTKNTQGVAGGMTGLTKAVVEDSGQYGSDMYRILPFFLQDGCNRYGLHASINVVPINDAFGITTGTVPTEERLVELCSIMVVRYVLDHFRTADEAVDFLKKHASIYMPQAITDMGYESHFMIADRNRSYVVEFINNSVVSVNANILSNFYLYGVTFNAGGTVYVPADGPGHHANENGVKDNGQGLERYNAVASAIDDVGSAEDARDVLDSILFSKAYTEREWYTEFTGDGLTVNSPVSAFSGRMEAAYEAYLNRDRDDPQTWHTTHSCVYDMETLSVDIRTQEEGRHSIGFRYTGDIGENGLIDGNIDSLLTGRTFDSLTVWNEYQTTGETEIPGRAFGTSSDLYPDAARRFRTWRMDIPRAKKNVTSGNRFGLDRIRNPWVYIKLKKNKGNFGQEMMQLHDVIVKYFSNR